MATGISYCPNCGAPVQSHISFCANCGAKTSSSSSQTTQTQQSYYGPTPISQPPVSTGAYKAVVAALLIIIVLLGILYYESSAGRLPFSLGTNHYQFLHEQRQRDRLLLHDGAIRTVQRLQWRCQLCLRILQLDSCDYKLPTVHPVHTGGGMRRLSSGIRGLRHRGYASECRCNAKRRSLRNRLLRSGWQLVLIRHWSCIQCPVDASVNAARISRI